MHFNSLLYCIFFVLFPYFYLSWLGLLSMELGPALSQPPQPARLNIVSPLSLTLSRAAGILQ